MTRAIVEAAVANDSQSGIGVAVKPGPDVAIGPVPPLSIDLKGGTTEKGALGESSTALQSLGELKVTSLKTTDDARDENQYGTKSCNVSCGVSCGVSCMCTGNGCSQQGCFQ